MFQVDIKYVNFFVLLFGLVCYNRPTLEHESSGSIAAAAVYIVDTRRFLTYRIWSPLWSFTMLEYSPLDTLVALDCAKLQSIVFQGSFRVDSQNTQKLFLFFRKREAHFTVFCAKNLNRVQDFVSFERRNKDHGWIERIHSATKKTHTEGLDGFKAMSTMCLAPIIYLPSSFALVNISQKKDTRKGGQREKWNEIIFLRQLLVLCFCDSDQLSYPFSSSLISSSVHNTKEPKRADNVEPREWWMEQMFVVWK